MKKLWLFLLVGAWSANVLEAAPAKIGVLLKDRDLFWSAAEQGAQAAGAAAGVELLVKAPLVPNSLSQQLAMLAALAREPIDLLIVAPLTTEDLSGPVGALAARGVKVIALDTPLAEGVAQVFLGYNQAVMAESAAKFFATRVPEGGKAALLRAYSIEGMSLREKTLLATFKQLRPDATLYSDIVAGAEKQNDYGQSLLLLERHPDAVAVCTPFTAASLAMTKAIQEKGLAGKVQHVGFGTGLPDAAVHALEGGAMQGWVAQQPKLIGSRAVEIAVDLLAGKAVPRTVDVPYFIVTPETLQDPQVQALRR